MSKSHLQILNVDPMDRCTYVYIGEVVLELLWGGTWNKGRMSDELSQTNKRGQKLVLKVVLVLILIFNFLVSLVNIKFI